MDKLADDGTWNSLVGRYVNWRRDTILQAVFFYSFLKVNA